MFTQGRVRVIALAVADILCAVAAFGVAVAGYRALGLFLRANGWPECPWGGYEIVEYARFLPVALAFVCVNAALNLYHGNWMYPSAPLGPVEEFRRLCISSLLTYAGLIAYIAFAYQSTDNRISRAACVYACVLTAAVAQSFRNWMRLVLRRFGVGQIPVVLAGDGQAARSIAATLEGDAYSGIRIVGYFAGTKRGENRRGEETGAFFRDSGIPYLGTLHDIVPESRKLNVKTLFACQDDRLFRAQMDEFATWFTYVDYLPASRAFPIFGARAVSFDGLGGLEMVNQGLMRMTRFNKRVMDGVFALVAFFVFLPVFLVVPPLVRLTSRGPVFYRHRRLGRYGRTIYILKFRTMYADAGERLKKILAEDPAAAEEWSRNFKLKNDPRVTPLGRFLRKTSLDELPQLFNVLAGEMALVGPRPIVEEEKAYYGDRYALLASVKPGMTGLWQVSGRSETDYSRRVALDAQYVLNWSPWMDIWILFRTVVAVLTMRGSC